MNEPQKKIIISISSFLVVLVLSISFIIIPWIKEMEIVSGDFIKEKQRIVILEEKIKNLDKIEIDLEKIEEGTEFYDNSFIKDEYPIQFITFLEEISSDGLKVNLSAIEVSKKEIDASLFNPLSFQLSVSGEYDSFARFLEKLESSSWLLEIINISISRSGEEGNNIRAELSFRVYREKK